MTSSVPKLHFYKLVRKAFRHFL